MSELDHEIRQGLERLGTSTGKSEALTFEQLGRRRRQRRIRTTVLTTLPILAVVGLFALGLSRLSDDTMVAADGDRASSTLPAASPTVSVERTEVVGSGGGRTARVVMEFDGPLPDRSVGYVDDITTADASRGMVFSIQQEGGHVQVCDSVHSFPPPFMGTVDLLIPAAWFTDGVETHTSELETIANPAKFVVCGPHNGFYQYAVWGPVSADPVDVVIAVDPDGRRLIIQIGPPLVESTLGPAPRDETCSPAVIRKDPSIGLPEVAARTAPGDEAWGLFFIQELLAPGDPIRVEVSTELKLVWRATGEGNPTIVAVGPDGVTIKPTDGPSPHGASNWERVPNGDEWGTGWLFPEEGCWRFELSRGGTVLATLDIEIVG